MEQLKATVYTPESPLRNPVRMAIDMVRDLITSRELAMQLAIRDIKAQYRQAALGLLWAFILPLANTAAWLFIQGTGIVTIQDTELPYPIYVFTGTIFWSIFVDALNSPLHQSSAAKSMIAKFNFPREALVLSGIIQVLFNSGIKVTVLFIILLFVGITPDWTLVLFPFALLSLVLAGTTVGLAITPIGMLYTDIAKGLPIVMQLFMYLTPVVFPMPTEGLAATVFQFNPLTPLILTARDLMTGYTPEYLNGYIFLNITMIVLIFVMWIIFRVGMPILTERISS